MLTTLSFGCWNTARNTKGSGSYVKEERPVENFSSLDVGGAFVVIFSQATEAKLIVEADKEGIGDIIAEIVGDELRIHMKPQ